MDEDYSVAFELIAFAGSSRSQSMEALQFARAGKFDEARLSLEAADADLRLAHKSQTGLIQAEAGGHPVPVNIILVHAQDHLATATVVFELASEFLHLYKRIPAAAAVD
ncbi:PTS lactose/cellobiose transporter subunit IIA [Cryobacterium sp. SO2]|uniref:PTS lactose/cellobiose transporter subunit IIA n=1 Tax=Cryobacterium sp. SO2 TaxID=1897060 RepID=UPI00223DF54E|nr:PTS lactose/cellobiose transporter subunit IIA [Cryobacterium sp. SO2]WEO78724.1 PTS lactose/cellobiose transporter subunit IIA [Cryobacterium sp. SO2]